MTAVDDDDLDPSAWLTAQFGEEPVPPKPAVAQPVVPEPTPSPTYLPPSVTAPPPFPPPPIVAPDPAFGQVPPVGQAAPFGQATPYTPPPSPPAPPAAVGGGFYWGLTPGVEPVAAPQDPTPAPYTPPPLVQAPPPVYPPAPTSPAAVDPAAFDQSPFGQQAPPPDPPPFLPPPGQFAAPAAATFPVEPTRSFPVPEQPTTAFPAPGERGTFPGGAVEPVAPDPSQWLAAPLDPALEGATEVFEAELVGLTGPQGEGLGASPLDDLFGDGQFRDFSDEPLIPPRQSGGTGGGGRGGAPKQPRAPRAPIPRNQKILMSIAGGLVALLALVALFAIGMKLASIAPKPVAAPSATPTATAKPTVLPVGPVKPGDYHWDQLLGGECLKAFDSAWQDDYTVVDCTTAHPAQLVFRGTFTDPASATYPGVDELQKRINLLCTPATIINYAIAGTVNDIQVLASYAVDEDDWDNGNHDYFCFVNRAAGEDLTASVAIQQVPVTPTPTPGVTTSATSGAPAGRGHAYGTKPTG